MTDQPPQGSQPEQPPQAPPTGNYTPPPAPPKKGMGTGAKIAIGCAILAVLGLVGCVVTVAVVGNDVKDEIDKNGGIGGTEQKVTMSQYEQVQEGMPRSEVENLLGGPGSETSSSDVAGSKITTYTWSGESFASTAIITFTDDKVTSKSQFGLE